MVPVTYCVFYLGVALHIAAAAAVLHYLKQGSNSSLLLAQRKTMAGILCLTASLLLRWITWNQVPLTISVDIMSLFLVLGSAIAILVAWNDQRRALLAFYLPILALLGVVAAVVAHPDLGEEPKLLSLDVSQKSLTGVLLIVHVGLAFLAFALYLIASLTSFAYIFQSRHLKKHKTSNLFMKLPSLEQLDTTLFLLIRIGYPAFVLTFILGLFWSWLARDLLSNTWWMSPKILLSVAMAILFSLCYHSRRLGWMRGPKLAYFISGSCGSLLAIYMSLVLLRISNHNFFGDL
jgi:ABC-type uncharacterized transport system permease subunit